MRDSGTHDSASNPPDQENRGGSDVETVITRVTLNDGAESDWDAIMRDRMSAAEAAQGWAAGCILKPAEERNVRLVLGLWETRAAWEQWHRDPAFQETAERLKGLERDAGDGSWHEVLYAGGRLQA
jgi:heme-degrading monooxygenase HmoA